jgi:flagellar biosynthetic protein FliP
MQMPKVFGRAIAALSFWGLSAAVWAQGLPLGQAVTRSKDAEGLVNTASTSYSVSIETMLLMTVLTLLPTILLMMTGFTRIVIVLSLLRQALGVNAIPPNQVVIGLSLILTFFVMAPTIDKINEQAYQPYAAKKISAVKALDEGVKPLKEFMLKQTRKDDVALFSKLADVSIERPEDTPLRVLMPAFLTSELKTAFQIGFMIFIPFLIIDMVVAAALMSMGMMMVPPATVSLPLKMIVFVLADGWVLLIGSLADSFL